MPSLGSHEKQLLLQMARRALVLAAEGRDPFEGFSTNGGLGRGRGAFVTLRSSGRLRGCIGQLSSNDPLTQVVAYCARAAALEDPRFDPVRPNELATIEIEISVLSSLETIAPAEIEVGKHGLVVSQAWQRGVLLPQVAAEFHWGAERFLEETCVKAGLGRDAWKDPATRIDAFTAEVFSESDLGRGAQEALETQGRARTGYSSST
jgi:uncharacterized protein